MRFFSAADRAQPTLLGYLAQRRSPKVWSLWRVHRRRVSRKGPKDPVWTRKWPPRGNSQLSEGWAATPFGRRFDRPDLMCAAQHPEFDRCATNPAPFV